jgi:hypothetical protein
MTMIDQMYENKTTDVELVSEMVSKIDSMYDTYKDFLDRGFNPPKNYQGDNLVGLVCEVSERLKGLWEILDGEYEYCELTEWLHETDKVVSRLASIAGLPPTTGVKINPPPGWIPD